MNNNNFKMSPFSQPFPGIQGHQHETQRQQPRWYSEETNYWCQSDHVPSQVSASILRPSSLVITNVTSSSSPFATPSLSLSFESQDLGFSLTGELESSAPAALVTISWSQFNCLTVWGIVSSKLIVLLTPGGVFRFRSGVDDVADVGLLELGLTAGFWTGFDTEIGIGSGNAELKRAGIWLACCVICWSIFFGEFVGDGRCKRDLWGAGRIFLSFGKWLLEPIAPELSV